MPSIVERNQSLKREDISNLMIMAKADETPFISMVRKGDEPENTLFEYPIDIPATPKIKGVVDEKDADMFENFAENRNRLQARVQIFERKPKVSRLANKVSNVAGVGKGKEFARSVAKAMVAAKLGMEARCLSNDDSNADDGNDGYETRGLGKWIQSTAQSDLPVPDAFRTPAGNIYTGATLANFSEDDFRAMLQSRWEAIGSKGKLVAFCGADFQSHIDDWSIYADTVANKTVIRSMNNEETKHTITSMVQMLVTSFGEVELYPHRWLLCSVSGEDAVATANLSDKGALILDMDMIEARFSQQPTKHELENKGGGPRAIIEAIMGLACKNPLAHCKVAPSG